VNLIATLALISKNILVSLIDKILCHKWHNSGAVSCLLLNPSMLSKSRNTITAKLFVYFHDLAEIRMQYMIIAESSYTITIYSFNQIVCLFHEILYETHSA